MRLTTRGWLSRESSPHALRALPRAVALGRRSGRGGLAGWQSLNAITAGGPESGHELRAVDVRKRFDVVLGQLAGEGDDLLDLLEDTQAPGANGEVSLDTGPQVGRDGSVEVVRDHLDEDGAREIVFGRRHRSARGHTSLASKYSSSARRTFERPRWSSTRWIVSERLSASQISPELHPSTSRSVITSCCAGGRSRMASRTIATVSPASRRSAG